MYKPHNMQPELVREHTRNGKVIGAHERAPKQFMQNKWMNTPTRIKMRDPEYHAYCDWRVANGMCDLRK